MPRLRDDHAAAVALPRRAAWLGWSRGEVQGDYYWTVGLGASAGGVAGLVCAAARAVMAGTKTSGAGGL